MSYTLADEQEQPRMTPAIRWLIAVNVAVYFLQAALLGDGFVIGVFGFHVRNLTERPWTLLTYMFVHAGILHIAVNMYMLWLFGRRVEAAWRPGSFLAYYVWCGLGAWLLHLMITRDGTLVGASGAIYGVMLAYAMRWPDEEMYFFPFPMPIRVKWMVAGLAALNLLMGLGLGGPSDRAYFAHLGGFAFGWLWLRWTATNAGVERLRQRMSQLPDVPDETPRAIPRSPPQARERRDGVDEIIARSKAVVAKRPAAPAPIAKPADAQADALDHVLDKIAAKGMSSLTSDERRLLEEMSKRLRKR